MALALLTTSTFLSPESWLSTLDPIKEDRLCRHFSAAQETVTKGVYAGRAKHTNTVWDQWITFADDLGLNPFLQAFKDKIPVLQVFAH